MKDVIRIELKKVLKPHIFAVLMAIVLGYSIYTSISWVSSYNIYDGNGNLLITAKENLKESKKHSMSLDEQTIQDVAERKDKSLFAYNSNLVLLITRNYDKKVTALKRKDITSFYQNRTKGVVNQAAEYAGYTRTDLESAKKSVLANRGNQMKQPIKLGYKEGWYSLNLDMEQVAVFVLILVSIVVLPIFAQSPKTKMKELCLSTKKGGRVQYRARAIAGLLAGSLLYFASMLIFTITRLVVLGPQGGNLPIQSAAVYFFSAWNISYIQQFLINLAIGFLAVLLMTSIVLFCGAILEQIVSTGAVVAFLWAFMLAPQPANITHFFSGFLPYNMLEFFGLYMNNETYLIAGFVLPRYIWVVTVAICCLVLFMAAVCFVAEYKIKYRFEYLGYNKMGLRI